MQLFILDENIDKNVQYYCDKHIVKILTEACQILCTVYRQHKRDNIPLFIYKSTHAKHPCTIWTGQCFENWQYTLNLADALYKEYQYRYNKPDKHLRALEIIEYLKTYNIDLPKSIMTPFALAMPDKYKNNNAILAYRQYYIGEKSHLFKWTKRNKPEWVLTI